jgi:hypothetical protein
LAFGAASNSKLEKNNHVSERDNEDFAYWRNLIDTVDSMATNAPTKSPIDTPTPPPVDVPTPVPVDPTLAPIDPPPVDDPTPAPVATTTTPAPSACKTIGTCCYYNKICNISATIKIKIGIEGYV